MFCCECQSTVLCDIFQNVFHQTHLISHPIEPNRILTLVSVFLWTPLKSQSTFACVQSFQCLVPTVLPDDEMLKAFYML